MKKNSLSYSQVILALCCCFFSITNVAAQDPSAWTTLYNQDEIVVNYTIQECNGKKQLALMVINNSALSKRIVLKLEVSQGLGTTKLPEGVFNVPANGNVLVDCNSRIPHLQPLQIEVRSADFVCTLSSIQSTAQ